MSEVVLPWHEANWQTLTSLIDNEKLPHGLMLSGPRYIGKSRFARHLAGRLLCTSSGDEPCGRCDRCLLMAAGTHPDFLHITLEESKQIRIEQIRDLIDWANQTSQQGGRKVCVINPAEKMNHQSANALLKCLEEPVADTYLILVTDQATALLPTIRSRCYRVEFHLPGRDQALAWLSQQLRQGTDVELMLDLAGGVPLKVVEEFDGDFLQTRESIAALLVPLASGNDSPLAAAAQLAKNDPDQVLGILFHLVTDSICHSLSNGKIPLRNKDITHVLEQYSELIPTPGRFEILDRILTARSATQGTSNANVQMLLEWVLLKSAPAA